MLKTFKSIEKENKKRLPVIANVIEARLASITGTIETLGSIVSHEIRNAKLLASKLLFLKSLFFSFSITPH